MISKNSVRERKSETRDWYRESRTKRGWGTQREKLKEKSWELQRNNVRALTCCLRGRFVVCASWWCWCCLFSTVLSTATIHRNITYNICYGLSKIMQLTKICLFFSLNLCILIRDEDPDPVGSVDFWPAGSVTLFNGSESGSGSYL